MFAANAHLHVWPGAATPLDCHGDELTNAIWIKADKGILLHDALGLGVQDTCEVDEPKLH